MGKGGTDPSVQLRADEAERNRKIQDNRTRINEIFDGAPITRKGAGQRTNVYEEGQKYYDAEGVEQDIAGRQIEYDQALDASINGGTQFNARGQTYGIAPPPKPAYLESLYPGFEESGGGGGFDDAYFKNIADSFVQYQTPLLEEQILEARRQLPTGYATTQSSAYLREKGFLERDYLRNQVDIADKGTDFSNQQRAEVERNRSDLLGQANSGTDAASIATQANARASALQKPPTFSPIADLFSKYAKSGSQAAQSKQLGDTSRLYYGAPSNSVKTIG